MRVKTTIIVTFEGDYAKFSGDFNEELQVEAEKFLCHDIIDTVGNRIWTDEKTTKIVISTLSGTGDDKAVRHTEYYTGG